MPKLLVVDDEPNVLYSLEKSLRSDTLDVLTASTGKQGLELVRRHQPDAVLLDLRLGDTSGLEVFDRIRQIDPRLPVILITAFSTTETAIEAMKRGAFEYLLKPVDFHRLRAVVNRALELNRLTRVPAVFEGGEKPDEAVDLIVGHCPAMQEVYKAIGRVAPQDVTVLIRGESGTGKELVARALYQHSRRAEKPFLAINCAAIPESLLESELFGHEKGAFTGADRKRIGKFEQCSGGTLFLDEIGDMAPALQAKLLRVLQEQTFERLGGNETIQADVRLIAATNQDLEAAVASGRFRQDLYYRLSVFAIRLPPLRERGADLPLLVQHYFRRYSRELGKDIQAVAPETLDVLRHHLWPGNVRELQSVLKQALLHATGPVLLPDFLPPDLSGRAAAPTGLTVSTLDTGITPADLGLETWIDERIRAGSGDLYAEALRRLEGTLLTRVLRHTGGNQVQAARILGITRGSLRTKVRDLGIRIDRTVTGGP